MSAKCESTQKTSISIINNCLFIPNRQIFVLEVGLLLKQSKQKTREMNLYPSSQITSKHHHISVHFGANAYCIISHYFMPYSQLNFSRSRQWNTSLFMPSHASSSAEQIKFQFKYFITFDSSVINNSIKKARSSKIAMQYYQCFQCF